MKLKALIWTRRKVKLVIGLVILLILVNEEFCYFASRWHWPQLSSSVATDRKLTVMLVSDPQLIGYRNEPSYLGWLTRWDSDRFLRKTFNMAYAHLQPDVILFLGDLLDEGSTAAADEFAASVHRFHAAFAAAPKNKRVYVSGDNDVGGEGMDPLTAEKLDRFVQAFPQDDSLVPTKFVELQKVNYMGMKLGDTARVGRRRSGAYRVLLSHSSVLFFNHVFTIDVVKKVKPELLICGHAHLSQISEVDNDKGTYRPRPFTAPGIIASLNTTAHLYEIMVPTCSYRMGMPTMGYGALIIEEHKQYDIARYAVLWSPSRFHYLYAYLPVLILLLILAATAMKRAKDAHSARWQHVNR